MLILILFRGLGKSTQVLLTHGDSIDKVGNGFSVIASSGNIVAGISNEEARIYGVQFHPEVDLTTEGSHMLRNFLFGISKIVPNFTLKSREIQCIEHVRSAVPPNNIVLVCFKIISYLFTAE